MTNQIIKDRLGQNLRFLRDQAGLTQKDLASLIASEDTAQKIRSTARNIGSYEEGRAFPQPDMMLKILAHFKLDYQTLVEKDLQQMDLTSLQAPKSANEKPALQVLAVPVDHKGKEKIAMVHEKAAAGYIKGFADREYIRELDSFHLPWLPTGASFRAFEISGDSMPPIQAGSVVLGKYVEKDQIKIGERYILVTKEGIVFKRVYLPPREGGEDSLLLTSDNPLFAPYEIHFQDVLEVWQFYAYIAMCKDK